MLKLVHAYAVTKTWLYICMPAVYMCIYYVYLANEYTVSQKICSPFYFFE